MDAEKTIVVVGATIPEMRAFLKKRAYKERDPVMLTELLQGNEGDECIFKHMEESNGKRLPDEQYTGMLRVVPDVDGVRGTFRAGNLRDRAMFWRTVDDVVKELRRDFRVRVEGEQAAPAEPTANQAATAQAHGATPTATKALAQDALQERELTKNHERKKTEGQIERLWREAKTDVQIGESIGLTASRVKQIRQEMGLVENPRKKKST